MLHGGRGGGFGFSPSLVDECEEDLIGLPAMRGNLVSVSSSINHTGRTLNFSQTFRTLLADVEALHYQEMDALRRKYEQMIAEMNSGGAMGSRFSAPELGSGPGPKSSSPTARPSVRSVAGADFPRRTVVKSNTQGTLGGMEACPSGPSAEDVPQHISPVSDPPQYISSMSEKRSTRGAPNPGDEDHPDVTPISRTLGTMHARFGSKTPSSPRRVRPPEVVAEESELEADSDWKPVGSTQLQQSGAVGPSASTASGAVATATVSTNSAARRLPAWSAGATRGAEVVELNRSLSTAPVKLSGNWDVAHPAKKGIGLDEDQYEVEEDDECNSPKSPGPARHGRFSDRDSMDASVALPTAADIGLREQAPAKFPAIAVLNLPSQGAGGDANNSPDSEAQRGTLRSSAARGSSDAGARNSYGLRWRYSDASKRAGGSMNSGGSMIFFDVGDVGPRPSPCVLSPVGYVRLAWDAMTLFSLSIDMWVTPFEIVFTSPDIKFNIVRTINYVILGFFTMDIFLNFNTGFINKDRLVMQRKEIVRKYIFGYFLLDLVATVPWDLVNTSTSVFGMTRLVKVTKLVKVLRFLRLLRMRRMRQVSRFQPIVLENLRYPLKVFQLVAFIFFAVHIHACVYGEIDSRIQPEDELALALNSYSTCLEWAYTVFFVGSTQESLSMQSGIGLRLLETFLVTVRVVLDQLIGAWLVIMVLDLLQESMKMSAVKNSVLKFFQQHKLSTQTQIQVMYTLHETKAAREMQRNFNYLMAQHVPIELRRAVSEELWTRQLLTLNLLVQVRAWHTEFLLELSMLVREEVVASKSMLCKAGSLSIAAYHVLKGRLAVEQGIPDFTPGMWVGERALLSTNVRRTWTVVARTMSALMSVPSASFADLIHKLGLEERYKALIDEKATHGLCGRCGDLGDHFTHACPMAEAAQQDTSRRRSTAAVFAQKVQSIIRRTPPGKPVGRKNRFSRRSSEASFSDDGTASHSTSKELYQVLHAHRLTKLLPVLKRHGVETTADISALPADAFQEFIGDDSQLRARVAMLRMALGDGQDPDAETNIFRGQHLMFLSHFKMEAGTEAALVRTEIENIFKEQPGTPAELFDAPVFLDSEDLDDLEELVHRVENSHNILVLLTKNVFTRPWVLIEVVTARRNGVRMLPVEVHKPSDKFTYPDEQWYERMQKGDILGQEARVMLEQNSIDLSEVVATIKELLKKISQPYSPHRSANIRRAEVMAVLKQCRFRDQNSNLHAVLTRLGDPLDAEESVGGAPSARRAGTRRMESFHVGQM
mmetsp:Transcript_107302/g.308719  ORF Transcript_107302/g.308719 Transcript_107302/m.308719 type:complete len:1278 (+) Transcript_107302:90-3923(+)